MRNVALFGQMASGKSAIARSLVDKGYVQLAFAEPLKNISELAYGRIDKSGLYAVTTMAGDEIQVSGREILQRVGQAIKDHDRDFWLRCFFNTAARFEGSPLVVDDGRFTFEADSLRDRGWLVVGINVPEEERMRRYRAQYGRYPTQIELSHQSEIELPGIIETADIIVSGLVAPELNARYILENG